MMIYQCEVHDQDFQKKGCETCTRILKRLKESKTRTKGPRRKLTGRFSVYWPSRMGHEGRVIENLDHKPTYVKNKDEFRHALKTRGLAEAG